MKPLFRRRDEAASANAETGEAGDESTRELALEDLLPELNVTLSEAAMLELLLFQELSDAVVDAPALANKQALGTIANEALERHKVFLELLDERVGNGAAAMTREAPDVEAFAQRTAGRDWFERITTCYVMSGFLHDLYRELFSRTAGDDAERIEALLNDEDSQAALRQILEPGFTHDVTLDDRLAMWGRRIIGDGMLFARGRFGIPVGVSADEHRPGAEAIIEEVTSHLMANHSRRMNAIGFAA